MSTVDQQLKHFSLRFKFEIINKKYGIDNVQRVTLQLPGGLRSFHQPRVRRINQHASPLIFNVTVWILKTYCRSMDSTHAPKTWSNILDHHQILSFNM